MKKHFILNLLINLGVMFLILSGVAAYQSGNMLILGGSIALAVVLVYLKIVLLKYVKKDLQNKQLEKVSESNRKTKK